MKEQQTEAALTIIKAVAEVIKEAGEIPSGHLYAAMMQYVSLNQYEQIINALKKTGKVRESYNLLTWVN